MLSLSLSLSLSLCRESSLEGRLQEMAAQHDQLQSDYSSVGHLRDEALSTQQELASRNEAQSSTISTLTDQLERY